MGAVMLRGFLAENFDELVSRTRAKAAARQSPPATSPGCGISLLLARLGAALRDEPSTASGVAVGSAAARHADALLEKGCTVSQIVHDFGDLREAIAELVSGQGRGVVPEEALRALERGLDRAIADTVAAYVRLKDEATSHREVERLGQVGHDLRNQLQTALLSFRALRTGKAEVGGRAGNILGRSLARLGDLIETRLPAVGLAATSRVSLATFVHEVAVPAHQEAQRRGIRLAIESGDPALAVDVDPRLLASALMSLLQNAFENTRTHGCVTLRTRCENGRALVEVEDECGGMQMSGRDPHRPVGDRRGAERAASEQGLASSRRAVQSNGGEVRAHHLPGKGCVFGIALPLAAPLAAWP